MSSSAGRSTEETAKLPLKEKVEQSNSKENTAKGNDVYEGNRIVNIATSIKNLKCHACKSTLSLEKIVDKKRRGLHSTFTIQCEVCTVLTQVYTGTYHEVHRGIPDCKQAVHTTINSKAVLAIYHAGLQREDFNKMLGIMNTPGIPENSFVEYEKEIGPLLMKLAAKTEAERIAREREQS